MKIKSLLIFLIISLSNISCLEPNQADFTTKITFTKDGINAPGGSVTISGSSVVIDKSGKYLVSGVSDEGFILVSTSSVELILADLYLSSKKNAPIIVSHDLKDIKINNNRNTTLNDLEDPETTEGECAVIKVSKNSVVYFENSDYLELNGKCKNIIKGLENSSLIFNKSPKGEYSINGDKTCIAGDEVLEFNGGTFTLNCENGDGIKAGKILINDGTFKVQSFEDAFTAKNNITIVNGKFNIQTEKGSDSTTFNKDDGSAKGFKVSNNDTGCGITVYNGEFYLNTADDAFHSKRDINLLSGKYDIHSKDDGISAKFNLVLGKEGASNEDLKITIYKSYEALEGMTITIYSGKINVTASDDGINAAGGSSTGNGKPKWDGSSMPPWGRNDSENPPRPPWDRNDSENPFGPPGGGDDSGFRPPMMMGNASYYVSIYDAEIYIFCDGDGIDSNGNIFIHGGNLNVFSQGNRDNEPIDHDGNFTLFNGEVLGVGSRGIEYIHAGILKGNQMYAYYHGKIQKNKLLEIYNEKDEVVKTGKITKDINYIFYSSQKLNENYKFYISDETNQKNPLKVTFNNPTKGLDTEDTNYNKKNDGDDIKKVSSSNHLKITILGIILLSLL
jgi:hypothetical protein